MLHQFQHRILGPVVLAWLVLTVVGVGIRTMLWYRLAGNVDASFEAAKFSHAMSGLYSSLQSAEGAERGFLLTGNESYLDPFHRAEKAMPGEFGELALMSVRDEFLRTNLLELRGLAEVKMSEMREIIKLRQAGNTAGAMALVNSANGQQSMNDLRQVITQMQTHGVVFFADTGLATRRQLAQTQAWGLAVGLFGIGAGLLALYLVRYIYLQEKAQQALARGKLIAEKTAGEKSAFLANISHEIRTPMNSILGFSELLDGESLTARQARYVQSIRQSGKSLLQLVNDVLDLSRLEANKLELRLEPTDVHEICNFLQIMFSQQATVKSLRLVLEPGDAPPALLLDRLRLQQVLVNLVGNAVKFTDRGHVRMWSEWVGRAGDRSRGALLFHVEDTGPGIKPGEQEKIFKPFVQLGPATAAAQGSGLGLSIARQLTQMMAGTLTVESTPGRGSVFHLTLPQVTVSTRLPVSDLPDSPEAVDFNDFEPVTLLVVDDNEANRKLGAGIFEGTHHTVREAASGQEALAQIAASKPSLVLLDLRMPEMDGLTVLEKIRAAGGLELLPVIAMTAAAPEAEDRNQRVHFNGFIHKPFSKRTLYQELSLILPRKRKPEPPVNGNGGNGGKSKPPQQASSGPASPGPARKAGDWPLLLAELRAMHATEWAGLRESLAINQTQAFAKRLRVLAKAMESKPLTAYADTLASHAEAYAVRDLEKQLSEFPKLVQNLEESPSQIRHE